MIEAEIAEQLEETYSENPRNAMSMYFFQHKGGWSAINAVPESSRFGRLINHSRENQNLKTEVYIDRNGKPRLVFTALRDIKPYERLWINYNDDRSGVKRAFPFLKK